MPAPEKDELLEERACELSMSKLEMLQFCTSQLLDQGYVPVKAVKLRQLNEKLTSANIALRSAPMLDGFAKEDVENSLNIVREIFGQRKNLSREVQSCSWENHKGNSK